MPTKVSLYGVIKVLLVIVGFIVVIGICRSIVIVVNEPPDDHIRDHQPLMVAYEYPAGTNEGQPPEDDAHELEIRNDDVLRLSLGSPSVKHRHTKVHMNDLNSTSQYITEIVQRTKWQQYRMNRFCSRVSGPQDGWPYSDEVLRHLIFDDTHKVIYCYVPKVGCTMMKTMFLLLQNIFTLKELELIHDVDHKHYLSKVKTFCTGTTHHSKALYCEPLHKIKHKLSTYYKFMIVRNPFERLLSAYNEKLASSTTSEYYKMKQKLVRQYSSEHNNETGPFPDFLQFIDVLVNTDKLNDDHFKPMVDICNPCGIKYDLYINFDNLNHEIDQLLHLLHIPREYYFNNKVKHPFLLMPQPATTTHVHFNTSMLTSKYAQLPTQLRKQVLNRYFTDVNFLISVADQNEIQKLKHLCKKLMEP